MKVLITAASSSIGKVLARSFADAGYELVLHYDKHAPDFPRANLLQASITSVSDIKKLAEDIAKEAPFDVIVNNLGVTLEDDLENPEFWETNFRINVSLPAVLLAMGRQLVRPGGCFINVSSAYGHERFGGVEDIGYSASKAAINSLTRTFAKTLAPEIRVNAVAPGYVDSAWNENRSEAERERLAHGQLTQKLVTREEVVSLVMELVNNKAIDGEIVFIDGGLTLKTIR